MESTPNRDREETFSFLSIVQICFVSPAGFQWKRSSNRNGFRNNMGISQRGIQIHECRCEGVSVHFNSGLGIHLARKQLPGATLAQPPLRPCSQWRTMPCPHLTFSPLSYLRTFYIVIPVDRIGRIPLYHSAQWEVRTVLGGSAGDSGERSPHAGQILAH